MKCVMRYARIPKFQLSGPTVYPYTVLLIISSMNITCLFRVKQGWLFRKEFYSSRHLDYVIDMCVYWYISTEQPFLMTV